MTTVTLGPREKRTMPKTSRDFACRIAGCARNKGDKIEITRSEDRHIFRVRMINAAGECWFIAESADLRLCFDGIQEV